MPFGYYTLRFCWRSIITSAIRPATLKPRTTSHSPAQNFSRALVPQNQDEATAGHAVTRSTIFIAQVHPFKSKENIMSRVPLETLEKLVQHNVALRETLVAAYGTPAAASLLAHAAASEMLKVTAEQIDELLAKTIAPLLPLPLKELDEIAAGYDPKLDPSRTDPYWSPADLPLGSTEAKKGYLGKSNA